MIFTPSKSSEFNAHIIPALSNYQKSQSEIVLLNSIHTKLQMEYVWKMSITLLLRELNTYLLYVFNFSFSFLSSFFSRTRREMEVSGV